MTYLFDLPTPALPIADSDQLFPLNRAFCVGRNYADHAREMGADPSREPPFFFSKPASAVFSPQGSVSYPPRTEELHHEVELLVALKQGGCNLSLAEARATVYGYAVAVDFTRRDIQAAAKKAGRPWDVAKGFDHSGPASALRPLTDTGWLDHGEITLTVNDELRQRGDLADMIWKVDEIIAELSTWYTLQAGDVIFTGTPSGVGPVSAGDRIHCQIADLGELGFQLK
ncbi:fumarylacetoacetate (FAA) hydrolase [Pseudohongiella nitratireducens]|uniref:Fumarylacetoacetate (FAA) hydrolase n=1 Tax=Pseudohongiella nitratireducens TaxID=1768907 RepID=A0A917GLP0_9GAMM|nr:fumarylacetoacetate hydrolase family protein [Pseudohongiella nitratireducens]MDF1622223.1 fumarylacetoacetate hydrolase family protein [Pseudohongiella nitratireducens]GGG50485.1 fumarylacetoacetate (FAA) hydrolase [Pseudohongiella nitratireducens]